MADEVFSRDVNRVTTQGGVGNSGGDIIESRYDDTSKRLLIDSTNEEVGHGAVGNGVVTLTSALTSVQVHAGQACKVVYVQAHQSNDGIVAVGGSDVLAGTTTINSRYFFPTQGGWFRVSNLNLLYASPRNASNSVTYYFEN